MKTKKSLLDIDRNVLAQYLKNAGQPAYRSEQIWQGLYHGLWQNWDEYTSIPVQLRKLLAGEYLPFPIKAIQRLVSKDQNTIKVLFGLQDHFRMETVLMKYEHRRTVCISSQVGCAMNCLFCATGQMGYKRNLTIAEIIAQVLFFSRELRETDQSLSNVVVMGMGEPFMNYETVMSAIGRLNQPQGFNLGSRRITISTVGLPHRIKQFADEDHQENLAVSLHASSDELRGKIIPISKEYRLDQVMDACRYYSTKTGRRVSFEWALIQDLNDSIEQARSLARILHGIRSHVNLIPLNPTPSFGKMPSSFNRANAFKQVLDQQGIACTIRLRRGLEIQAGCGQLASHEQNTGSTRNQS